MEFHCIEDCSQCCIEREYYPSKKFGKIGVLIIPEEKERIEELGKKKELEIKILPRIGISENKDSIPTKILAYQLMGNEKNGDTCPFLDLKSDEKSPHGGHPCKIYNQRPLACSAYPLSELDPITLDQKCKFCKENGNADENLNSEIESLLKIKEKMVPDAEFIWRYATNIGEPEDQEIMESGWILEEWNEPIVGIEKKHQKIQKASELWTSMSEDAWSNLDKVDQEIIEILNDNARTPSKEIASELKKSQVMMSQIEQLEKK